MDGWNTTFLLGRPIFRGYVSFREGNFSTFNLGAFHVVLRTRDDQGAFLLGRRDPTSWLFGLSATTSSARVHDSQGSRLFFFWRVRRQVEKQNLHKKQRSACFFLGCCFSDCFLWTEIWREHMETTPTNTTKSHRPCYGPRKFSLSNAGLFFLFFFISVFCEDRQTINVLVENGPGYTGEKAKPPRVAEAQAINTTLSWSNYGTCIINVSISHQICQDLHNQNALGVHEPSVCIS